MKVLTQSAVWFLFVATYSALGIENNVRLTNIQQSDDVVEGEVEIHYEGIWRPLCARMWTKMDADAICRTIGFHQGAVANKKNDLYGQTKRRNYYYLFTGLSCGKADFSLDQCPGWNNNVMTLAVCAHGIAIAA
uniref:SRCR domain-containing protein n=1 Tax=Strigamia maritima TaxID=126957 RepID=T1IWU6_STRMM